MPDILEATLREELLAARLETERLFEIIRPEHLYERPIDARHRVVFYMGHLEGFDSIQICREGLGLNSPEPEFDSLFQAGIDPDSTHLPSDQPKDWPVIDRIREYCERSRAHVDRYLDEAPGSVIHMALEHRLMHLETLAYMFHNFDYSVKRAPADLQLSQSNGTVANEWREIPGGDALLGKRHDGNFGWDNEYNLHRVPVRAFRVQRYPVTNGEYLEFVKETGGALPNFWRERDGELYLRCMFSETKLPLDWPVYVSQLEAQAYARWRGYRLMSEAEYHRAAFGPRAGSYPWGTEAPVPEHGNFDFRQWDPAPVDSTPGGDSSFGVAQLFGNGWEWTGTEFAPFPGFEPSASYPGYSANFFDGEHFVMKGGSSRTSARLLRSSFRNWFRRDYPYMYAKFRCVQDLH